VEYCLRSPTECLILPPLKVEIVHEDSDSVSPGGVLPE
jgi:hypothetical protein